MERFVEDLTGYARELEEGGAAFGGVTLCHSPDDEGDNGNNGGRALLRCDRDMTLLWRRFARAVSLRSEDQADDGRRARRGREGWWIANAELTKEVLDLLAPALTSRTDLRTLILDRNGLAGRDDPGFLASVLEGSSSLRRLSYHNNPLGGLEDASRFGEVVRGHPSLEHLTLENVGLGGDELMIGAILGACGGLTCLGLSGNGLGSSYAAEAVAAFLATCDAKLVYLRDNEFGDDVAPLFAAALKRNERLRVLDLSGNRFASSGARTIRDALFDPSSLDAAAGSNHGCVAYVDEAALKDRLGAINSKGTEGENLQWKVTALLYAAVGGEQLGRFLGGVPSRLMPRALEFVQRGRPEDVPRGIWKHAMELLRGRYASDSEEDFQRRTTLGMLFEVLRISDLLLATCVIGGEPIASALKSIGKSPKPL